MNQQERLALAEKVATDFYSRLRNKLGGKAQNRVDVSDLKQEAACFVLERAEDARMSEPDYLTRNVINCLRRLVYRECKIGDIETAFAEEEDSEEKDPALIDNRPFSDPAHRAALNEVLSAVDDLPTKQREVTIGLLNGGTVQSMANTLCLSHQAVSQRCSGAVNSLRTMLRVA